MRYGRDPKERSSRSRSLSQERGLPDPSRRARPVSETISLCWCNAEVQRELAYIRVSADLLDDILIEVASVAHKTASDVVGVLETREDVIDHRGLRALTELGLSDLSLLVEVLHPAVVLSSQVLGNMVLELDHVVVRNLLCVGGREDGSSIVVDAVNKHRRRSRECCQRDASQGATHDGQYMEFWGENGQCSTV